MAIVWSLGVAALFRRFWIEGSGISNPWLKGEAGSQLQGPDTAVPSDLPITPNLLVLCRS